MPKEKKTDDMKAYQKKYREEHPKNKEEQNDYMKKYIAEHSESIDCPVCGGKFKTYARYKHDRTKKHLTALIEIKDKEEREKLKKEEEELAKKAQEEAETKAEKEKPKKKKNKLVLVEKKRDTPSTPTTSGIVKKPIPAPRKKKEETPSAPTTSGIVKEKPVPAPRKPKEKPAALKALEEYESSSSSESEEEEEKSVLEKMQFKFQSKTINSEEVEKWLITHHESSANPARSAESKTPRLNKNKSLWNKVKAELNGKTWKYVGEHFGEIVKKAYDKPSSQADFIQMLKMVIFHFTKVPVPEQKRISLLARALKEAHVSKQK